MTLHNCRNSGANVFRNLKLPEGISNNERKRVKSD